MIHIAGLSLVIGGRLHRQRCAWCGLTLIDEDLSRMMAPLGPTGAVARDGVYAFALNALVEVREGNPKAFTVLPEQENLPAGSCVNLL